METSSTLTCRPAFPEASWQTTCSAETAPRGAWSLEVVPQATIRLHEDHDPARATPLVQAMRREGVQRHPVIVAREPNGRLLHLDGANRLTALKQLQCPHVVAQVVDYADPQVELTTWVHLTRLAPDMVAPDAAPWPGQHLDAIALADVPAVLGQARCVAVIIEASGKVLAISSGMGLLDRVQTMRQLAATYRLPPVREALPGEPWLKGLPALFARTPQATAAVVFAPLRKVDVVTLVLDLEIPMPAGVTRHLLHGGRLLQVNAPLALLQADLPVAEKAARLRGHLARQRCRVYAEPTLVYEPVDAV